MKRRSGRGKGMHNLIPEAVGRVIWMYRVRDCRHICLFCRHYGMCKEDGIPEGRGKGR